MGIHHGQLFQSSQVPILTIIYTMKSTPYVCMLGALWSWATYTNRLPASIPSAPVSLWLLPLYIYQAVEILFFFVQDFMTFKAQRQIDGVVPTFSRQFIRKVYARALENGMGQQIDAPNARRRESVEMQVAHSNQGDPARHLSFMKTPLAFEDPRALAFRQSQSKWFLGAPWSAIKRDNFLEWLAWSMYTQQLTDIRYEHASGKKHKIHPDDTSDPCSGDKLAFLDWCMTLIEARAGCEITPGYNPTVKCIRLHLDPVQVEKRPFWLYAGLHCTNIAISRGLERSAGFVRIHDRTHQYEYLLRMPPDWQPTDSHSSLPILVLHGLGCGLMQYIELIRYLASKDELKNRPIVIVLQHHISMELFRKAHTRPPTRARFEAGARAMIARHGFEKGLAVLSHSNGTIVHGWLLKSFPDLVKRSCFTDPVTFCLWQPDVPLNFLRATPKTGMDKLMRYFVARELGVAITLSRYFDWSSNITFFEDIPDPTSRHHTLICLAEADSILSSTLIRDYFLERGLKMLDQGGNVHVEKGAKHGEMLTVDGDGLKLVEAWLCDRSDEHTLRRSMRRATCAGRRQAQHAVDTAAYLSRRHLFGFGAANQRSKAQKQGNVTTFHERKILPYTRQQLYSIVADIDNYSKFVPYCVGSKVLATPSIAGRRPWLLGRTEGEHHQLQAELTIGYMGFEEAYVSTVECVKWNSVQATANQHRLFETLKTSWTLSPAASASPHPTASGDPNPAAHGPGPTMVSLDLAWRFANPLHEAAAGAVFERLSTKTLTAFIERVRQVYGPGKVDIQISRGFLSMLDLPFVGICVCKES
ncbi:uncharacterized protein L969DRAFT_43942 [Mixia osmundae IAM 14324]|uniref:Coenzyme Q-binding protein COQ10 START domain-containing protein n=1 Tax=Mixia osmundae (strain CBS 9802 / IAM 14324 / JCM 22182 / KY 12970) TaxID=764103 RepID=G7EAG2_MIXOS|nr:uncharacterized protein L969DRAFT_43942 [Mixia osmundae IAM 14324]KEI42312.1 hypothetical protein L969DRAFT_43942 [Mixia osmundae IAM 14324]GAA99822.1 hypothetical protein E5Q_06525 [Mixia osmundae IAM 14324]